MIELVIDTAIALMLLALAGGAIFSPTLLGCIALFIAFGMALTLAWVRLEAVDLALAEAAIGAGLTGVLLLNALAQGQPQKRSHQLPVYARLAGTVTIVALLLLLSGTILEFWPNAPQGPLAALAQQQLGASGVSHPVTAVLLNFRAWDTLLELLVMLLALVGIKQLQPMAPATAVPPWPLLLAWSRFLAPLLVLAAGYLLWRGASAPGGAFQAGAVLAAGAIILRLNHLLPTMPWSAWQIRIPVLLAPACFIGVALATFWFGDGWLYPTAHSGILIVVIEIAATLTVATTLTFLVVGEEKEMHA